MESIFLQFLLVIVMALALTAVVLAVLGTKIKYRWSMTSMYNVAACLVVSSILAGTISFLAVWLALPNCRAVDYTHQDVVVDIFGVLVTVLIGWNILSVVDIRKKAEKIDTISEDLQNVISGIIQLSIHGFTLRPDKEAVINSCFLSLKKVLECDNEKVRHTATDEVMEVLFQIKKSYNKGEKACIYEDMKMEYEFILSKIDNVHTEEIRVMIKEATLLAANAESVKFANRGQQGPVYSTDRDNQS